MNVQLVPDSFLAAERLWLLAAVGALAILYLVLQLRRRTYAVRFTNLELLDKVAPARPGWRRHVPALGFLLALSALVVAFARPSQDTQVPKEQATVIMAIDTSLSMQADDVRPTRLDGAKEAESRIRGLWIGGLAGALTGVLAALARRKRQARNIAGQGSATASGRDGAEG